MAVQTTGLLTSEAKTYYDRLLLEAGRPTLFHQKWARKRNIPTGEGQTIQFRRFELLNTATTALTEGVTPPGSDLTITAITAVPAQYGDYVQFSDYVTWTAIDPVLNETVEIQGVQAGQTLDNITRDVIVAGTTVRYAAGRAGRSSVTAADLINATELRKVRRTLRKNKAKTIDGYFIALISPDTHYDLQDIPEFKAMGEMSDPDAIKSGMVKRLWGMEFYETEQAKVFTAAGSGSIDVHASLFFGADFYGATAINGHAMETVMKPLGSAGTSDPLNQRQSVGWKATYVAKILNDNFGCRLEHAVTG